MRENEVQVLAAYGRGEMRQHDLQAALEDNWSELTSTAEMRGRIAQLLGISDAQVLEMTKPPVRFGTWESGTVGGVELVVLSWIAKEVLLKLFADKAKGFLDSKLTQLWQEVLLPTLRKRLPDNESLGPPQPVPKPDRPS